MAYKHVRVLSTKGFGTHNLRIGDLTGNGIPDFLLTQSYFCNREISCITAMDIDGNILWQNGTPRPDGDKNYSDLPIQIFDWDQDGRNEVVYIKQATYKIADVWDIPTGTRIFVDATKDYDHFRNNPNWSAERSDSYVGKAELIILDGATGEQKASYEIPESADDCVGFGFFDGTGKPNAIVKNRYWKSWVMNHEGEILWEFSGNCHFPAVGDIDGDGLDEIFVSDTLYDHDGKVLWALNDTPTHHDAAYIIDDTDEPRIIVAADKIRCLSAKGEVLWEYIAGHEQNAAIGKFSNDPAHGPYQILGLDLMPGYTDWAAACADFNTRKWAECKHIMYDWNGNVLWTRMEPQRAGGMLPLNWTGKGDSLVYIPPMADETGARPVLVLNGAGETVEKFYMLDTEGNPVTGTVYVENVLGDSRDEIVVYNADVINVVTNGAAVPNRRQYNTTHYRSMY